MFPEAFYQTTATIAFTLLGLWWIALQAKYNEWIGDPLRRRMVSVITLYFLLPGSMSLLALLAIENRVLWRVAFVVACLIGVLATGLLAADALKVTGGAQASPATWNWRVMRWSCWVGIALYLLVAVVALGATTLKEAGIEPLLAAGVLVTLIVILGLVLAWTYYVEPPPAAPSARESREIRRLMPPTRSPRRPGRPAGSKPA